MPDKILFFEPENRRETGFSLIELMISLSVFLIFIAAIYGVLRIANVQKSTVNSQTDVMRNLRLSLNTIGRDAVNAGLGYSRIGGNMPDNLTNVRMGLPADVNATPDLLTAVIGGDNINTNVFLTGGVRTDVIAFAQEDKTFGPPMGITDAAALNGNDLTLTAAPTTQVPNLFDLYFITENDRTAMALVTTKTSNTSLQFQTADPLGINAPYNGNANNKSRLTKCLNAAEVSCMNYTINAAGPSATAKKIIWVSYSVTNDGTLIRTSYGNNKDGTAAQQIQNQPIAYDIQNLQIRYLLRNGTFTNDPSAVGTNQLALNSVVQIQVTLTARITVQENGVSVQRPVDLKSTFSTKNLNYDVS